ncbi:MAG: ATP synthase subunit I [Firmicutes bacterium]|nr:ATP synthase subunit I [Bacillota bacterium]
MSELKKQEQSTFWQLSGKIAVVGLIILVVGCFFAEILPWIVGVVLGTVFTIVRLKMMQDSINKSVYMDSKKQASSYANFQFIMRQMLCIIVLGVAVVVPWINPIGAVLPMFGMSLAAHWQSWVDSRKPKDPNAKYEEWDDDETEEDDEEWDRWETYNLKAKRKLDKLKKQDEE